MAACDWETTRRRAYFCCQALGAAVGFHPRFALLGTQLAPVKGEGLQQARLFQSDMDNHSIKASRPDNYLEIASSLVAPRSFLFPPHATTPPNLPVRPARARSRTMDKAQTPSSFQQLEKVRGRLLTSISRFGAV